MIPKTERLERLKENIDFYDFELTEEEVEQIRKLDKGQRMVDTLLVNIFNPKN